MQLDALLTLAYKVPSISPLQSAQWIERALALVRPLAHDILSGELAKVALFYAAHGMSAQAQAAFEEALRAATTQEGSRGLQQIAQALLQAPVPCPDWMLTQAVQQLQQLQQQGAQVVGAHAAFAYIDLAQVAMQRGNRALAVELVAAGAVAAQAMESQRGRASALEKLANIGIEVGYQKDLPKPSVAARAVQQARAGRAPQALAMVSRLSQNLYVDHGQAAYARVLEDAIQREDVGTALYFAQHPVRPTTWGQTDTWRQVAELQAQQGAQQEAAQSYQRASQAMLGQHENTRYFEHVRSALRLSTSMYAHGLQAEARQTTLAALDMAALIAERRADDRIRAATLAAQVLWQQGQPAEAKQQVLRAYRAARAEVESGTKGTQGPARWLSELGHTTSSFIDARPTPLLEGQGGQLAK